MFRWKIKRSLAMVLAGILLAAVITGCTGNGVSRDGGKAGKQGAESEGFPIEITDVLGRRVVIDKKPQRIISATPSTTETLFALGVGELIVGVSRQCDYPEEALRVEKVGDFFEPNIEKIISLEPDIVFVGNKAPEEFIQRFDDTGVTVLSMEAVDFEATYQCILDIGRITGSLVQAERIVKSIKDKVEEIQNLTRGAEKRECYYIVSFGEWGNYTAGPGNFIHEMIHMSGGINIAGDMDQPWPEFSLEKLVELDPPVVMISTNSDPEGVIDAEGYRELTAIREGRLKIVNENLVVRPGPRLGEGLEEIARAVHPELFE